MKNRFTADPMNIFGLVLVLLLAFTVILTLFLLVGYERLTPTQENSPTDSDSPHVSGSDGTSSPLGEMTSSPEDDGDREQTSSGTVTGSPSDTTSAAERGDTSMSPALTSPPSRETTSLPPDTTEPPTTSPSQSGKKLVAFTYDDGPHAVYTPELLKVLDKYNVKATFFILGTNARKDDAIAALKATAAAGHEMANHTYSHPTVLNITVDELKAEIEKTNDLIYKHCGVRPTLVRTPGGKWSADILSGVSYPIIHWTVDTRDWDHNDPERCLAYLKDQVYDGAIVLMHDRKSNVAKSTELMIKWLVENDYEIVTVSELMERKGVELTAGKVYYSSKRVKKG